MLASVLYSRRDVSSNRTSPSTCLRRWPTRWASFSARKSSMGGFYGGRPYQNSVPAVSPDRLGAAYRAARDKLLAERTPGGHWVGELSSSALATATAATALAVVARS